jgi:hypothetical protein
MSVNNVNRKLVEPDYLKCETQLFLPANAQKLRVAEDRADGAEAHRNSPVLRLA